MYLVKGLNTTKQPNDWDYSKFVAEVQAGNAQAVTIHPEDRLVIGATSDKREFKVVMPDDPNQNLLKSLLDKNVKVSVEPPKNNFIWALLIQLGPIVLIFA